MYYVHHDPFEVFDLFDSVRGKLTTTNDHTGKVVYSVVVSSKGDFHTLEAVVPGVKKEDVKIYIENNIVSLTVKKAIDGKEVSEHKLWTLSNDYDPTEINCTLADGILKVSIPKIKPKRLEVKVN